MNNNFNIVLNTLKSGGLAILPTDTAVGIACRIDSPDFIQLIYEIKNRPEKKPLLILADSIEMAKKYAIFNPRVEEFARTYWPAGITLILPCIEGMVPDAVRSGGESVAIRVPASGVLRRIIRDIGVPLVAPSANLAGEKTPYSLKEVDSSIMESVKIVLEGDCKYKKESTIIDTTKNPWQIVREGAVKVHLL